jgi:hypothetical protein
MQVCPEKSNMLDSRPVGSSHCRWSKLTVKTGLCNKLYLTQSYLSVSTRSQKSLQCFKQISYQEQVQCSEQTTNKQTNNQRTYCINYKLKTAWCWGFLEKLIVAQLVKIACYRTLWKPKLHWRVDKSAPLDPILNQRTTSSPSHSLSMMLC